MNGEQFPFGRWGNPEDEQIVLLLGGHPAHEVVDQGYNVGFPINSGQSNHSAIPTTNMFGKVFVNMKRRKYLSRFTAAGALTMFAGCAAQGLDNQTMDIGLKIRNTTFDPVTINTKIRESNGLPIIGDSEIVFESTDELDQGISSEFVEDDSNVRTATLDGQRGGEYAIAAEVNDDIAVSKTLNLNCDSGDAELTIEIEDRPSSPDSKYAIDVRRICPGDWSAV